MKTYIPDNEEPWNKPGESNAFKGGLPRDFDICWDNFPWGFEVPTDDVLFIK